MNERTKEERLTQCLEIMKKLSSLDLHISLSGVKELSKVSNDFIKNGKEFDGVIRFEEYPKMKLIVCLSLSKRRECSVTIRQK